MRRVTTSVGKVAACIALALAGSLHEAADAAQRTFVASHGDDLGVCSLAAPCRSFAAAMALTDTDGEIIVLDSAGYGRVSIDRSVSITSPPGVYAGISVFAGTNGVDITGPGTVVVLRGLSINGQGGDVGIAFTQGLRLYVEHCIVANMSSRGISVETGDVYITDSTIRGNSSYGIWAEGAVTVAVDRSRIERTNFTGMRILNGPKVVVTNSVIAGNYGFGGIDIDSDDGASTTSVTVTDSNLSHNGSGAIIALATNAGSIVRLALARNTISGNMYTGVELTANTGTLTALVTDNTIVRNLGNGGIHAAGAGVTVTLAGNAITTNSTFGVRQATTALVRTRANNVIQDNGTDISGTLTVVSGD